MIAVIADDLTGAAELGGIGLTYGLDVEIGLSVNPTSTANLVVIATDARSVDESEAVRKMTGVSKALRAMKPQLIYKKVDSVLRGHVVAETLAQLSVLGLAKSLIVPANPALGRTLVNGYYYVHGELIHQTHFTEDPEFPVTESDVLKRLNTSLACLSVQSHTTDLPTTGIVIGEVEQQEDLHAWVNRLDNQTLAGGGAGFFTAILDSLLLSKQVVDEPVTLGEYRLYVCGSAFGKGAELVKKAVDSRHSVSYMPDELMRSGRLETSKLTNWVAEIIGYFHQHEQVIIAIEPDFIENRNGLAMHLRTVMAKVVKQVLSQISIQELIIEGGSTASAVLREINVTRLVPVQELAAGVVRSIAIEKAECRPEDLHITVKPGSYSWPTELWTC